jgi:Na+/alanine symporter
MSMINYIYSLFNYIDTFIWGYFAIFIIIFLGIFLSITDFIPQY